MANIQNVALVDRGKVVTGGGSGGHTIINESGTSLAQEPNLQFKGADISDDSTNNRTVVDMSYTEIDYEDWLELTEQEKETGRWDVVGVPGADGTVSVELMTKLWENPSPSESFGEQDAILSSDDYDVLMIISRTSRKDHVTIIRKGEDGIIQYSAGTIRYRLISYVSNTKLHFDSGSYNPTYNSNPTTDNNYCVPIAIYGIKTSQTVEIKAIAPEVSTSASKCMMSDGETSVESKVNDVESASITLTGFAGSITLDRVGRICFATYLGNINSLPTGSLSFSQTLPEKFRPIHTVGFHSSATNSVKIELFFSSNGSITGYNYSGKISSTTTCTFEALSYVALNV